MKGFHPATWVVLKLRCSSALCLLVLPSYEQQQRRGQLMVNSHHASYPSPFTASPPMDWPTSRTVQQLSNQDESEETSKFQRLKSTMANWRPVQTFLSGGKSIVRLFRVNQKTEMEAAFGESPSLVTTKEMTISKEGPTAVDTTDVDLPKGPRWAVAHPEVDLSGTWKPIITSDFKDEYEKYLTNCGTTFVFRQVCLNFCSTTRETVHQVDDGRVLHFHAKSPAGGWKRSLISSGADTTSEDFEAVHAEFLDPDKEMVKVEAWWEDQGKVHKSVLRDKAGVSGGYFETLRYLTKHNDTDRDILVTESTFHPSPDHLDKPSSKFKPGFVRWKYEREG